MILLLLPALFGHVLAQHHALKEAHTALAAALLAGERLRGERDEARKLLRQVPSPRPIPPRPASPWEALRELGTAPRERPGLSLAELLDPAWTPEDG